MGLNQITEAMMNTCSADSAMQLYQIARYPLVHLFISLISNRIQLYEPPFWQQVLLWIQFDSFPPMRMKFFKHKLHFSVVNGIVTKRLVYIYFKIRTQENRGLQQVAQLNHPVIPPRYCPLGLFSKGDCRVVP